MQRVEHASSALAGDTLDVTLHLQGGGEHAGQAMVCAGLPVGWAVESAAYSATTDGSDVLTGDALRHVEPESRFGNNPDRHWSCWVHPEAQSWSDASSGRVDLVVRIPEQASGRADLQWTLGSAGLYGEYISARAQSVVTVGAGAHPLDALSFDNGGIDVVATGSRPGGFLGLSETGLLSSDDGINWVRTADGLAGAAAVGAGGVGTYAVAGEQLWSLADGWQPVALPAADSVSEVFFTPGAVFALGQTEEGDTGLWQVGSDGPALAPQGARLSGLSMHGDYAAWLADDAVDRTAFAWVRSQPGAPWVRVSGPPDEPAQAMRHAVAIDDTGGLLWARALTNPSGSHVQLWQAGLDGDWVLVGSLPTPDIATPHRPVRGHTGWLVYDGVGAVVSVEPGCPAVRHPMARTVEHGDVLVSGRRVVWVQQGRPVGAADWAPVPSVGALELAPGRVDEPYLAELPVDDGVAVQLEGLPDGLFVGEGRIRGVPQEAGTFSVSVLAEDAWGRSAMTDGELTIAEAILPDEPIDADTEGDEDVDRDTDTDRFDVDTALPEDTGPTGSISAPTGCSSVPSRVGWVALGLSLLAVRRRR